MPAEWRDPALEAKWERVHRLRRVVLGALEEVRVRKEIGSSLEARAVLFLSDAELLAALDGVDMAEVAITSGFEVEAARARAGGCLPPSAGGRRRGGDRAGQGTQMRALVEIFRRGRLRPRLSRRDARAMPRRCANMTPRGRPPNDDAAPGAHGRLHGRRPRRSASTRPTRPGCSGRSHIAEKGRVALTPFLDLVLVWNRGVSYGLFTQDGDVGRWLLIALGMVGAALFSWWLVGHARRCLPALSLGLVIGGALSNVIDRLVHGAVADFFLFHVGGVRMVCIQPCRCVDRGRRDRPGARLGARAPRNRHGSMRTACAPGNAAMSRAAAVSCYKAGIRRVLVMGRP